MTCLKRLASSAVIWMCAAIFITWQLKLAAATQLLYDQLQVERLHQYAEENNAEAVAVLLKGGVNPDDREEEHGRSAVHFASKAGSVEVLKVLMEYGANLNSRAKSESLPLHYSSNMGHIEVTRFLLEKGADVDSRNQYGRTPLQYAANFKHTEVVALLLDYGADINARDVSGRTALRYAVVASDLDTIKLLLDRGASRDSKTHKGESPLDFADDENVRELLQNYFRDL